MVQEFRIGEKKTTENPLSCRKCNETVLPDRPISSPNGIWVLRYIWAWEREISPFIGALTVYVQTGYRILGLYEVRDLRYPRKNMEPTRDPLRCRQCEGALLPNRVIPLKSGLMVLRYACIHCRSRSYAVKVDSTVHMYPSLSVIEAFDAQR